MKRRSCGRAGASESAERTAYPASTRGPGARRTPERPQGEAGLPERRVISTWVVPPGSLNDSLGLQNHDVSVERADLHERSSAGDRALPDLDRPAGVLRLAVD